MKKLLSSIVLGLAFTASAFATCDATTGYNIVNGQNNGKCTTGELSSACDVDSYASKVCQTACENGSIGQQSAACQKLLGGNSTHAIPGR